MDARGTVEERIVDSFRRTKGQDTCDLCLATTLKLGSGKNATMARNTTAVLGAIPEMFTRRDGWCPQCRREKLVTRWNG